MTPIVSRSEVATRPADPALSARISPLSARTGARYRPGLRQRRATLTQDARRTISWLTPERLWSYPIAVISGFVPVLIYKQIAGGKARTIGDLGSDFLSFYTGGAFVLRGMPEGLLDPKAQQIFQQRLQSTSENTVSIWVSPPYFAWLFAPFAHLGFSAALTLLLALSLLGVAWATRALTRELPQGVTCRRALGIAALHVPTWYWLLSGQMSGLWFTVVTWVFLLLRRDREIAAGLLLGCIACKPQLGMGLLVALVVMRRWRVLVSSGATTAGFLLIGLATFPDVTAAYLRRAGTLVSLVRSSNFPRTGLCGSLEFATLLLDGVSQRLATVLGCVICLGLLGKIAILWYRADWRPGTRDWDLRMAATLALGVIASPHLFHYDLMLLLLPLYVVASHYHRSDGVPLDGGVLLLTTAAVWLMSITSQSLLELQQRLWQRVVGAPVGVQLIVVAVAAWGLCVARATESLSREIAQSELAG